MAAEARIFLESHFAEGAGRLWWKAVFEGDGATALALLKAEFDALIGGPGAYEMDLADQL